MSYLLDTDVFAAAIKGRLPVVLKLADLRPSAVAISVMAQVEAETALRLQPQARTRYGRLLKEFLGSVKVLDFGAAEAQQAINLGVYLQSVGEALAPLDLIQAATALSHQLTLVTDRPSVYTGVPNLDVERWA